jgi:hypothetical protein
MALSAKAPRKSDECSTIKSYPVAQGAVCYQGGLAVINSSGYVQPGTSTTGLTAVGIFDFSGDVIDGVVDNTSGNNGDLYARVRAGIFCFTNWSDAVVEADVEGVCYIYDDTTVCHTGSGKSVAGIVRRVDTDGVWVWIGAPWTAALTAEAVSRAGITTDLALTTTGKGAALVGVYNSPAGKITATNVQTALMENIDARRIALGTDGNTLPVPMVMISKTIANASADTDITLNATYGGIQITGVRCVKAAGSATGGDATITVKSTANAITDAISLSGITAGLAKDASTYVPAYSGIPSGGILRITAAKSTGDAACTVIITGYRVS